jgi:hypothetical protein
MDWSDAAITHPALDVARLYRDFGPAFLEELLLVHGPLPEAMPRIEFFAISPPGERPGGANTSRTPSTASLGSFRAARPRASSSGRESER